MIQTGQRTDSRKTASEQKRLPEQKRKQPGIERPEPEQTLRAVLSGVSPDRLSPEAVLALSRRMGNSALAEAIAGSRRAPEPVDCPTPPPLPDMRAASLGDGPADLIAPVDFSGLTPLETGAGPAFGSV